jgi:hypothetical protein
MHEHDEVEDAFGFEALRVSTKDRIRQISPSAPSAPPPDLEEVDRVASEAGFVSREVPIHEDLVFRRGRPRSSEPSEALNMRVPSSVAYAFRRWCEENRYSYPAALAEIMRRAGISSR